MTVIKAFNNEKKPDGEPLVQDAGQQDVETGTGPDSPADPQLLMMTVRAKRASTITTLLLIVACSLVFTIALCGAFYIYKQFLHSRYQRFRTSCYVPYYDEGDDHLAYQSGPYSAEQTMKEQAEVEDVFKFVKDAEAMASEMFNNAMQQELTPVRPATGKSFKEDFEFDLKSGAYEKIHVPEFKQGRSSKFIHDFSANMTGIIDLAAERCFVMPLDRSVVLPPQSLMDLINKMNTGYYTMNPSQLSETYRAIETPVDDLSSLGTHIAHACQDYTVYRLEKAVGGVVKRSADDSSSKAFTVLDGAQTRAIEILNIDALPTAIQK